MSFRWDAFNIEKMIEQKKYCTTNNTIFNINTFNDNKNNSLCTTNNNIFYINALNYNININIYNTNNIIFNINTFNYNYNYNIIIMLVVGPKGVGGWVGVWTQGGWGLDPRGLGFGSFGVWTQGVWGLGPFMSGSKGVRLSVFRPKEGCVRVWTQ